MRFVGGYDRFDLWVYNKEHQARDEVRVIWGEEARRWTWLEYDERTRELFIYSDLIDLIDGPSNDETALLIQYLRCFVPEIAELVGD